MKNFSYRNLLDGLCLEPSQNIPLAIFRNKSHMSMAILSHLLKLLRHHLLNLHFEANDIIYDGNFSEYLCLYSQFLNKCKSFGDNFIPTEKENGGNDVCRNDHIDSLNFHSMLNNVENLLITLLNGPYASHNSKLKEDDRNSKMSDSDNCNRKINMSNRKEDEYRNINNCTMIVSSFISISMDDFAQKLRQYRNQLSKGGLMFCILYDIDSTYFEKLYSNASLNSRGFYRYIYSKYGVANYDISALYSLLKQSGFLHSAISSENIQWDNYEHSTFDDYTNDTSSAYSSHNYNAQWHGSNSFEKKILHKNGKNDSSRDFCNKYLSAFYDWTIYENRNLFHDLMAEARKIIMNNIYNKAPSISTEDDMWDKRLEIDANIQCLCKATIIIGS